MLDHVIDEKYVSMFRDGTLGSVLEQKPFPHAYFPNIFTSSFFDAIIDDTKIAPKYSYKARGSGTKIFYEPFENELFIRSICGRQFRDFLAACVGCRTVTRSIGRVPQLRHLVGDKSGINIHTDATSNVEFICVFGMNTEWRKGMGGELCIWQKLNKHQFQKVKELAPKGNSMLLVFFGDDAYHSVSGLNGDWNRRVILTEWDRVF